MQGVGYNISVFRNKICCNDKKTQHQSQLMVFIIHMGNVLVMMMMMMTTMIIVIIIIIVVTVIIIIIITITIIGCG
jgi:hypothetical protein